MSEQVLNAAIELIRDLEHEHTMLCLGRKVRTPTSVERIIKVLTGLADTTQSIEDVEAAMESIKDGCFQDGHSGGYDEAIQDVLDVLRKEGVDNTVILAVKELTI